MDPCANGVSCRMFSSLPYPHHLGFAVGIWGNGQLNNNLYNGQLLAELNSH